MRYREIQRQAIRHRDGCNTARLGEIVPDASDSETGVLICAAASSFNGAAYNRSDANPRSAVAVARTRSSEMPLMTIKGTAIATCNAAVTR